MPVDCNQRACCYEDAGVPTCVMATEAECLALHGFWNSSAGSCEGVECDDGWCCLAGECYGPGWEQIPCQNAGGQWALTWAGCETIC